MYMFKVMLSNSETVKIEITMAKFKAFFSLFAVLFQMRNYRKTAHDFQDFLFLKISKSSYVPTCPFFFPQKCIVVKHLDENKLVTKIRKK